MNDDVEEVLRDLPRANPAAAHSARVRARCHKAMSRRPYSRPLESALVGGFCAIYITGVALLALHAHGLL